MTCGRLFLVTRRTARANASPAALDSADREERCDQAGLAEARRFLANGDSIDDILAASPDLRSEDVRACLAYAAELTRERVLPVPS
jgi:hypothetical protein